MPMIAPTASVIDELNARYGTQLSDKFEVVKWPYYDSQAYAMAGQTRLAFYQAVTTDFDLSNVEQAAAFPSPKKFFVRGLGLHLTGAGLFSVTAATAGTAIHARFNDVQAVFNTGRYTLTIGNKQYLIAGPLGIIPDPIVYSGFAATHFTQAMAADRQLTDGNTQQGSGARDTFLLDPPLLIDSQINFVATTEWTTASAVSAATRLFAYFLGQMIRPAQ